LDDYEFFGEKVMTAMMVQDGKRMIFINMREYGDLLGKDVIYAICRGTRLEEN
jgi:hypothetical protein